MTLHNIPTQYRQQHLHIALSTRSVMQNVMVALCPALVMAIYFFGFRVLFLTLVSIFSCVAFEALYQYFAKRPITISDLSACVTGMLLAMCLPPSAPYWAPVLGSFFAIVVVKQFYGGIGCNFMNPALAGRMLLCTFPLLMTSWTRALDWLPIFGKVDAVTAATPLAYLHVGTLPKENILQLLLGQHGGSIGEISSLMLILGGLYLISRHIISPRIPLTFIGTVFLLTFAFPLDGTRLQWATAQIFSGGVILGAFFMATDYVTSPITPRGQRFFGIGCGALTVLLRYFGSYPDGVGWALLAMNCCVWLLDRVGLPRRFGTARFTMFLQQLKRMEKSISEIKVVMPRLPRPIFVHGQVPAEGYLDDLRQISKNAAAFFAVLIVVFGMVFGVHRLTEFRTYMQTEEFNKALLQSVMPGADTLAETPHRSPDAISISAAYKKTQLIGHCVTVQVAGFTGNITMLVGVDLEGRVTGCYIEEHNETLIMGTAALEERYLSRFIGRSGTIKVDSIQSADTVTGATITSKAVISGFNKALSVVANLDPNEEHSYANGEYS